MTFIKSVIKTRGLFWDNKITFKEAMCSEIIKWEDAMFSRPNDK